jgi:hypothetical protein
MQLGGLAGMTALTMGLTPGGDKKQKKPESDDLE